MAVAVATMMKVMVPVMELKVLPVHVCVLLMVLVLMVMVPVITGTPTIVGPVAPPVVVVVQWAMRAAQAALVATRRRETVPYLRPIIPLLLESRTAVGPSRKGWVV